MSKTDTPTAYTRVYNSLKDSNMPRPHGLITISWEDVIDEAITACKKKYGRDPTRGEIIEIFDSVVSNDEIYLESFWLSIEHSTIETYGL